MTAAKARFSHINFPHYANIISDPLRVTSWTTKVHDKFIASRIGKTLDGQRIPFMRFSEKEKFLRVGVKVFFDFLYLKLQVFRIRFT